MAFALKTRPTAKEMVPLAEAWRPWRGVAARLLWAYYRASKGRDAVPVQPTTYQEWSRDGRRAQRAAHRAALGQGPPPRRVPPRLRGGRQRYDRHRPRLAAASARRRIRVAARAAAMRPGADGSRVVSIDLPRSERALERMSRGGAGAEPVSRCRACPSRPARIGAGAGWVQPGHHDGPAHRTAPRRRAGGHRRLFRPVRAAPRQRSRRREGRDRGAAADPARPRRPRRAHSGAGAVSFGADAGRPGGAGGMASVARHRPRHRCRGPAPGRGVSGAAVDQAVASSEWRVANRKGAFSSLLAIRYSLFALTSAAPTGRRPAYPAAG